jgi:anti-anti-sigma regulatory factor
VTSVLHDHRETIRTVPTLSGPIVVVTMSYPQADTAMCRVSGTVDLVTASELADRLISTVHDGRPHLIIDLSAVAVLNATGLHAALDALDSCDIAGHLAIVIDSRSEMISRSEISALSEVVDIHHDLASALRGCARASVSSGGRHRAKDPIQFHAS